jgi:hypothetical protein
MWMAIIVAWALLFAWIRSQGSIHYAQVVAANSYIAWALSFLVAFACARKYGPILRGSRGRATVFVLVAPVVAVALNLAWGHRRAYYDFVNGLEEGFPYPDQALNALDLWFEARNPVPPGSLKLHGEWNRVTLVLGTAVLVMAGVCGLLAVVLSNRSRGEKMSIPRLVDVVVALIGLTLLCPLIAMIAITVRISSRGSVLIRKLMLRGDDTTFSIDLFRTNHLDSDQPTRIGRCLRSNSLDYLPALVTLLRGGVTLRDFWTLLAALIRETAA